MEVGVDNCHVGKKLVVCEGILNATLLVGNNCEGGNFGACTCGGGNCDEVCLLTHLGEGVNSLADIDEAHCHIHEVCLGMLVENPHDLCGVHCRTTAKGDDGVGLECSHLRRTLGCVCKGGVGLYVEECLVLNTHLVKLVGDGLGVTVLVKECVGYDECLLCASDCTKLVESNGETTLLDIYLLRCSEPKHVFSPLCYCLNVQKMLYANVVGNAVAAPRATTKCKRGSKAEVVKVTDTALRRRGVEKDTAGLHSLGELSKLLSLSDFVKVDRGCVTEAAVLNKSVSLVKSLIEALCTVHCEYGRKLLVSELLGDINACHLTDEDLCALGNLYACKSGNLVCRLTNDLCIKCAVDDNGLTNLLDLLCAQEVAAAVSEFCLNLIVDVGENDNRLLGCADHTVVEGLGVNYRVNGKKNVCRAVDDCRSVTCAYAKCRLTAGVCRANHAGATGSEDDVSLLHNGVGHVDGGAVDPVDDSLGCACRYCCLKNKSCRRRGTILCSGVGGDDDTVSGLQGEKALEDCGRGGVGGRNYRRNNSDRLCNLGDTKGLVLLDNAAGLGVLICVVDILCRIVVLDNLVLNDAHAGLCYCHLCEGDSCLVSRTCRREEDLVNLLLGICCVDSLSFSESADGIFEALYAVNNLSFFHFL